MSTLLSVRDLVVEVPAQNIKIIDGISFDLKAGETLGLVGESGCGKSMTCYAIANMLPKGVVHTQGKIDFCNHNATAPATAKPSIAMIFQDPTSSLNPVHTIGYYLQSTLARHQNLKGNDARMEAIRLLERVGINQAKQGLKAYPHQFSGGMNQRVMIAHALAAKPQLLIADEPTTALDVTMQAQILHLLEELKAETGMALIIVSHDLGVIARLADKAAVMYCGKITEAAPVADLLKKPVHPYARALIGCMPSINPENLEPPVPIPGAVPMLNDLPDGCYFHPRCAHARDVCGQVFPSPTPVNHAHTVSCYYPVVS